MALKITEVNGKIFLEGNINSVTRPLLKKHIKMMKDAIRLSSEHFNREINYVVDLRFED